MVSPLRRCASTMIDRAPRPAPRHARGARLARSVSSVIVNKSMAPPAVAATPSQGWIRKQMNRNTGTQGKSTMAIGPGTGQKGADLIEVADRLRPFARMPRRDSKADHRAMNGHGKALIEQRRRADNHARADQIERALECIGADQKDRERDQRRHAPAAQDPIVDLQHVERAGEHQQIHDAREHGHAREGAPAIAQGRCDVGMGRITAGKDHLDTFSWSRRSVD